MKTNEFIQALSSWHDLTFENAAAIFEDIQSHLSNKHFKEEIRPAKPKKSDLLAKYFSKPVTQFRQYDFFKDEIECGCGEQHELTGGAAYATTTDELMEGADVRVLIKEGTSKADALRGLMTLLEFVNDDFGKPQSIEVPF